MDVKKKKRLLRISLVSVFLAFALLCAFVLRYRFWWLYGVYDSLGGGEKGLLTEVSYEKEGLISISASETEGIIKYSNVMWLVNSSHLLPGEDIPAVSDAGDGFLVNTLALSDLNRLFDECEAENGKGILFTSTFRSHDLQASIYETNPFAVPPGESEHETGLAVDIKVEGYAQLRFIMSDTGRWMAKNSYKYGFIIRYPFWATDITGVTYEPWHLRYVGSPHAEIIYRSKIALEDYHKLFKEGCFYSFGDYIISYQSANDGMLIFPDNLNNISVSPDNTGMYYIWGEK